MEAAVARVVEVFRKPMDFLYQPNVDRQSAKIARALDHIEVRVRDIGTEPNIGTITLACALGYLDFRLPKIEWRRTRGATAEWYLPFTARRSMIATQPRLS
jgi:hypothetical protein